MTDEKRKYQHSGLTTIVTTNFLPLLGCNALAVLTLLIHNDDLHKSNHISITAIIINVGGTSKNTVVRCLKDLTCLKLIEKKTVTERGTNYIINYDVINKYKSQLDAITSPVERLRQCDSIRIANGLKPI